MNFTRLAVRFAVMTILCSTTAEAINKCPVGGCPPPPPPPPVIIPTAVTTCDCANAAALETAAKSYLSTWIQLTPPGYTGVINAIGYPTVGTRGTSVIVVSTSVPISGIANAENNGGHSTHALAMNSPAKSCPPSVARLARNRRRCITSFEQHN